VVWVRPDAEPARRMAALRVAAVLMALGLGAHGMELTPATWDEKTAGKTVFIKFLAPW